MLCHGTVFCILVRQRSRSFRFLLYPYEKIIWLCNIFYLHEDIKIQLHRQRSILAEIMPCRKEPQTLQGCRRKLCAPPIRRFVFKSLGNAGLGQDPARLEWQPCTIDKILLVGVPENAIIQQTDMRAVGRTSVRETTGKPVIIPVRLEPIFTPAGIRRHIQNRRRSPL